ncbi:MAG: polyprenyl synthetase family protein, partial [Thermoprotei archaeon]
MELQEYLKYVSSRVNEFMEELVRGEPKEIYEAAMHLIRAGGKRLRPAIAMLSGRIAGGAEGEENALPGAAAVEIFHNFTLIHDDIIDRDEFRRGVPTVHKLWGVELAIVAGDLLYA